MKAPRKPEADPKQDAVSAVAVPRRSAPDARANELDALFGDQGGLGSRPDAEVAAAREKLAALFGQPVESSRGSSRPPTEDITRDVDHFFAHLAPGPDELAEPKPHDLPASVPHTLAEPAAREPAEVAADDDEVEVAPQEQTELRAPVPAATAVLLPAIPREVLEPANPLSPPADTSIASTGSFMPARRRGVLGWSTRVRWWVAASVVLLAAITAGAFLFAQTTAADDQAARVLAAATAELEAAESSVTEPYAIMESAFADYDATVLAAHAVTDSAAPALASVAGMADETALAAAGAALAELVAQLDESTLPAPPAAYERDDVDMTDLGQIAAATQDANDSAERIARATRGARAAQTAIVEKSAALTAAQKALGTSLPATAVVIVGENPQAVQSFRDAVIAASVAVPAAQNAGASGDAELLTYAAAVTALRADQTRAESNRTPTPVTPPASESNPAPAPEPVPPDPAPTPTPTPTATETVPPIPPETVP